MMTKLSRAALLARVLAYWAGRAARARITLLRLRAIKRLKERANSMTMKNNRPSRLVRLLLRVYLWPYEWRVRLVGWHFDRWRDLTSLTIQALFWINERKHSANVVLAPSATAGRATSIVYEEYAVVDEPPYDPIADGPVVRRAVLTVGAVVGALALVVAGLARAVRRA